MEIKKSPKAVLFAFGFLKSGLDRKICADLEIAAVIRDREGRVSRKGTRPADLEIIEVEAFVIQDIVDRDDGDRAGVDGDAVIDAVAAVGPANEDLHAVDFQEGGLVIEFIEDCPEFFDPLVTGHTFDYKAGIADVIGAGRHIDLFHVSSFVNFQRSFPRIPDDR